ncbi:DUF4097 family beta strand repeat-containing protein [Galbibacter sp. EGI 63066]|uniref:DUF4097 family beta strand repeat-containing protein n=1 Tax=Galbibacter sp. EGI 63066 TaxID=2993559 RepID=UPI0022497476|nr:DUF4097 family beta strand repeat-containing protein [Galbibacter sp. EGI 63066]MCX2679062.1 DUF4097 family beta strand repeat-containing protein [Galbibacter sp. EGI 63066]
MKSFKLFIASFFICVSTLAQSNYTHSLEGIEWVKIETKSDVIVETYNQNSLTIKADRSETPEKAKGLKLVGLGGVDNTEVGFYVIKEGNNLIVKNLRKEGEVPVILLPASTNISVNASGIDSDVSIDGFSSEIECTIKVTGGLKIKDVTGPITANTNTGEIDVIFSKVNQSSPISITTTTGDIDVSLPNTTSADLVLRSTTGEIYTDFDLNLESEDGLKMVSARTVKGTLNNGGVQIQLNSATGTIYLRKQ